jgi:hypothetical protein
MRAALLLTALLLLAPDTARRRAESPLDQLPANVEVLTHFGERADVSPDNRRVAFMAKSFGDAFVIDLETRVIRCLTCNVPGASFLRVMQRRAGRSHDRRAGLPPRGPGLLRRRPQAQLLLLRAGGPRERLDARPRDR